MPGLRHRADELAVAEQEQEVGCLPEADRPSIQPFDPDEERIDGTGRAVCKSTIINTPTAFNEWPFL